MQKITAILLLAGLSRSVCAQQELRPADLPLEAFAQLPTMIEAAISPDGSHLAYIRPINGRGHLVIQTLEQDGSSPAVVPPAETTDFSWLRWGNDDRLVFAVSAQRKRGSVETVETRLMAINEDGSDPAYIIEPSRGKRTGSNLRQDFAPAQIQDDVVSWLPDEPDFILVALDGDHNAADEVRKVDIRNGNFTDLQPDYEGIQNWLIDRNGEPRLGWGFDNTRFTLMLRQPGEPLRSVTDVPWRDNGFFPLAFTDDPNIAYMLGPDENGVEYIRLMNVETNEFLDTIAARDGIDVGGLLYDSVTGHPVGYHVTEHAPEYHYFDSTLDAIQKAIDKVRPNSVNQIVSTTRDRRKILVFSSSDTDPGAYMYLDRDLGALEYIAEAMPGLAPELMSPMDPIQYAASDGENIPGYLTVPRGLPREKLKLVVMPHGGPAARDNKSFWFLTQFLAARGYAVFQPNFRGSTGYGRRFEFAGRKEWGGKMQEDVTDGVRWLIDEGIADPDRICIVGWSYGGYAAAMGAIQTPELYQCAASINGVLNLPRLIADDRDYIGGTVWTRHMGLEDEKLMNVSPYQQADRLTMPLLIIQAQDDSRVHLDQGKQMARRLERQKKPVEYVEVELGGHSMTNGPARETILRSLESFLARNLAED